MLPSAITEKEWTNCHLTKVVSLNDQQYPLLALSVRCPQMVWGCACVCVLVCIHWHSTEWTNMWIMPTLNIVHTSSSFHPHMHTLTPFEDHELTRLKVDIAKWWSRTHQQSTTVFSTDQFSQLTSFDCTLDYTCIKFQLWNQDLSTNTITVLVCVVSEILGCLFLGINMQHALFHILCLNITCPYIFIF